MNEERSPIAGFQCRALDTDGGSIFVHDRAALDHPECVSHVAVLDVVPTFDVWDRADARLALAFWPFSLLAQPAPLPERLLSAAPDAIVDNAISEWGPSPATFPKWLREAYVDALREPAHVHAICEEYRAAAGIDREIDEVDLNAGRRIDCPVLALWSDQGGLANWYDDAGGPLGLWSRWANDVQGQPISGGHFFPEEQPAITAELLGVFLKANRVPDWLAALGPDVDRQFLASRARWQTFDKFGYRSNLTRRRPFPTMHLRMMRALWRCHNCSFFPRSGCQPRASAAPASGRQRESSTKGA